MALKADPDTELTEYNQNEDANQENITKEPDKSNSCCDIITNFFSSFTVEPYLICYIFPIAMSALAVNQFNIEKACRVDLNHTEETCTKYIDDKTDNFTIKARTDALILVSNMMSWQSYIKNIIPIILVLFVGAWSDKTGNRKALMLIPLFGELVSLLGLILATYFFLEWPLWITALIESVPTGLTGGFTIALMGSFSYVTDVTTLDSRTLRIGIVSVIAVLGGPIATAMSGILVKELGYYGVFGIAFALYLIGFIYTLFNIHDVKRVKQDLTNWEHIKLFFNPKNFWDTASVILLPRGRQLALIILVLCAAIFVSGPGSGEAAIMYNYIVKKVPMEEVELSLFLTYFLVSGVAGTAIVVALFVKLLKLSDTVLGIIATLSKILGSIAYGVAPTKKWFYAGPAFEMFVGASGLAIKSLGTKVVAAENTAKIFSLIGLVETITSMVYTSIYSKVFAVTIETLPEAAYFLSPVLLLPAFITFIALNILIRRQERDKPNNPAEKEIHAYDNCNDTPL